MSARLITFRCCKELSKELDSIKLEWFIQRYKQSSKMKINKSQKIEIIKLKLLKQDK